ncbi:FAD-dependent monooxygenase [Tomitella gaofuii]|uniref:FAD-dependent monooxygenase n=1 Tax=Tomitella gaofuii TaxID=2760083 RepID=UPI0015F8902E|nr:FAD-dependent monooxygenase [Tomitella gaofuii]
MKNKSPTGSEIIVAGAGIGGLAAALALHARGAAVTVLESASELAPLGVGINLQPEAVDAIAELRLRDVLASFAIPTSQSLYLTQDGIELARRTFGGRVQQFSVHRGQLQMMLYEAAYKRLPEGSIITGARVTGFEEVGDEVVVHTAGRDDFRGAALLGADGVHSAVRSQLHPGADPYLWEGTTMYRGTCDSDTQFLDGRSMVLVYGENGTRFLAYPISREAEKRGRSLINWVAMLPEHGPAELGDDGTRNIPATAADVVPVVRGWGFEWLDIEGLVAGSHDVLRYPMVDRAPLHSWGRGRVTLLGDAAHPMYPIGANGGSQAILDAMEFARNAASDVDMGLVTDVADALHCYEGERRPSTTDVVQANRRLNATERAIARRAPDELQEMSASGEFDRIQSAYARGDFDAI